MTQLKVAVVGTGYFSQYHYDAWSRIPQARIEALCYRSDASKAEQVARQYSIPKQFDNLEQMLDEIEPDLLDIVSPPETHLEIVRAGAARSIPMITQKPMAPTHVEAQEMADLAEASNTLLVVHENWRFKPWFREIHRVLETGLLGRLYNVSFLMRPGDGQGPEAYLDRQPYFQKMPRFLIHETGVHMIDVFRFLLGEPSGIYAHLRRLNPVIAGEDAGHVLFDFSSELTALLDGNRLAEVPAKNPRLTMGEMLLEGSDARLRLDADAALWLKCRGEQERRHEYHWENRGYSGDSVHALQSHVVAHLLHGAPVENVARDYLRNIAIEEATYQANEEKRRLAL